MAVHAQTQPVDRLATVSSNDSTPDTLKNKITSTGGTVTITEVNDGGNEKLNIETITSDAMVAHGYIRVTGNNAAKNYLDPRDWRGRGLEIWFAGQQGNAAFVESVIWATGWNFQGQIVGSTWAPGPDSQLALTAAGANVRFFIESGTGKIYVTTDAFAAEGQVKFLIVGRQTDAAATITV